MLGIWTSRLLHIQLDDAFPISKVFSIQCFDPDTENDFCPTDRLIPFNNKKAISNNLFFKVSLNCPQIMSKYVK